MCATCEIAVRVANDEAYRERFELMYFGSRMPLSLVLENMWLVANSRREPMRLFLDGSHPTT